MYTLAGSTVGFADDTGNAAKFNAPNGVHAAPSGDLYVADSGNNRIRRVSPTGVVTTLAGNGSSGLVDGPAASAEFNNPYGVVIATDGTVYVADTSNNCIRKIDANGNVSTFAGGGTAGFSDGVGNAAKFNSPFSVTLDNVGNLLVADTGNNAIRRVTPARTVTTLIGNTSGFQDGPLASARLSLPNDVACDGNGNIYIADFGNNAVRKVDVQKSTLVTLAGSGTAGNRDGAGLAALFNSPTGLALDLSGNVYVADNGNNCIRKILPSGTVTTLAGSKAGDTDGALDEATFNSPASLTVDANRNIIIADSQNNCLRVLANGF